MIHPTLSDEPIIVIADQSVTGSSLEKELKSKGFAVVGDVAPRLLANQMVPGHAHLVIIDADAAGTTEALTRVHSIAGSRVIVIALGRPSAAIAHHVIASFLRPVQLSKVVERVEALMSELRYQQPPRSERISEPKIATIDVEKIILEVESNPNERVEKGLPPDEELKALLPAHLLAHLEEAIDVDSAQSVPNPPSSPPTITPPARSPSTNPAAETRSDSAPASEGTGARVYPPSRAFASDLPEQTSFAITPVESVEYGDPPVHDTPTAGRAQELTPSPVAKSEQPKDVLSEIEPAPVASIRQVLSEPEDVLELLADSILQRKSGVLRFEDARGVRRVVLSEGDILTVASAVEGESLMAYLLSKREISDEASRLEGRIPPFGRRAAAALVAHGYLSQNRLHDVLEFHASWLLTRVLYMTLGAVRFEVEPPARLRDEPSAFGGAAGPAVFVDVVRRCVSPRHAVERLGGGDARLLAGARPDIQVECGLSPQELEFAGRVVGQSVAMLQEKTADDESALTMIYALVLLSVFAVSEGVQAPNGKRAMSDVSDPLLDAKIDESAIRSAIAARRSLVDDGDYFLVLGVDPNATGYEIRRAYLELRRAFDSKTLMRPSLLDLRDDLRLILQVIDEAYDVLKDPTRRDRYRRAITPTNPH
jgi:hypothetical protein